MWPSPEIPGYPRFSGRVGPCWLVLALEMLALGAEDLTSANSKFQANRGKVLPLPAAICISLLIDSALQEPKSP